MSGPKVTVTTTATVTWDDGGTSTISMAQSATAEMALPTTIDHLIQAVSAKTLRAALELENEIAS